MFLYFQRNKGISIQRTCFKAVDGILNLPTTLSCVYSQNTDRRQTSKIKFTYVRTKKVFRTQSRLTWIFHYTWKEMTKNNKDVSFFHRIISPQNLACIKLCLGVNNEWIKSLWFKIKVQISEGDAVVGACYRPPDQKEQVDEAFYRQLEAASKSQALVLVGEFNYPDICWRSNTVKHKQSRRFLENGKQRLQLPVTGSGGSHKEWCAV